MDDRIDGMFANDLRYQFAVADIADDERRFRRNRPVETARKPVENDDLLAVVEQFPDHVAADISGSAGHQYAHAETPVAAFHRSSCCNDPETTKILRRHRPVTWTVQFSTDTLIGIKGMKPGLWSLKRGSGVAF
jgi:hypothetical protein